MSFRYLPAIIPLALGIYFGLTWDSIRSRLQLDQYGLPSEYEVLTPSLVKEIEDMRKRWEIGAGSIAVVKQDEGQEYDEWRSDSLGLGEADWSGTKVDETVSSLDKRSRSAFKRHNDLKLKLFNLPVDSVLNRIEYEAFRGVIDRYHGCERDLLAW